MLHMAMSLLSYRVTDLVSNVAAKNHLLGIIWLGYIIFIYLQVYFGQVYSIRKNLSSELLQAIYW